MLQDAVDTETNVFYQFTTDKNMYYQNLIIKATNCKPEDAAEIEEYMRSVYFQSTLDWQTKAQLNKGARESWKDIQFIRSPEGKRYIEKLKEPAEYKALAREIYTSEI